MTDSLRAQLRSAIAAPSEYAERADNGQELIVFWQARAVEALLLTHVQAGPDAETVRELAALAMSRLARADHAAAQVDELKKRVADLEQELAGQLYPAGWPL